MPIIEIKESVLIAIIKTLLVLLIISVGVYGAYYAGFIGNKIIM